MERILIISLCSMLFLIGCTTTRLADLTIVSTKNIDFSKITPEKIKSGVKAEGRDVTWGVSNMETAIDKALEAGNGDLMIDAVVYMYSGWNSGYVIEGTVINLKE